MLVSDPSVHFSSVKPQDLSVQHVQELLINNLVKVSFHSFLMISLVKKSSAPIKWKYVIWKTTKRLT